MFLNRISPREHRCGRALSGACPVLTKGLLVLLATSSSMKGADAFSPGPDSTPPYRVTSTGTISISSVPAGARIIIDNTPTKRTTPAVLDSIPTGIHTVSVSLRNHQFVQRPVRVYPDSLSTLSFRLFLNRDTAYVTGTAPTSVVVVIPDPGEAVILKGGTILGRGIQRLNMAREDTFALTIRRYGYLTHDTSCVHTENIGIDTLQIALKKIADADGDGFADTADSCPEEHGFYEGCPRPRLKTVVADKLYEFADSIKNDLPACTIRLLGHVSRTPLNPRFRRFLSLFSDFGPIMNNYRGFCAGNSIRFSGKGMSASFDFGQWLSGLEYRRRDTVYIDTEDERFMILYDSLSGRIPAVFFTTTSAAAGVHFSVGRVDIVYSPGYQWEDIILHNITGNDNRSTRAVFNNDHWFHYLHGSVAFPVGRPFLPLLFASLKLPLKPAPYTSWNTVTIGMEVCLCRGKK